jgi:DNA-binding transcriptional regulator PaaX
MEKRERLVKNIKIEKPKKWDKKWRLVFFDFSSDTSVKHNALCRKLDDLGFVMLANDTYIYPYECFAVIESLVKIYKMEACLKYKLVASIKETEGVIIMLKNKITQ